MDIEIKAINCFLKGNFGTPLKISGSIILIFMGRVEIGYH